MKCYNIIPTKTPSRLSKSAKNMANGNYSNYLQTPYKRVCTVLCTRTIIKSSLFRAKVAAGSCLKYFLKYKAVKIAIQDFSF